MTFLQLQWKLKSPNTSRFGPPIPHIPSTDLTSWIQRQKNIFFLSLLLKKKTKIFAKLIIIPQPAFSNNSTKSSPPAFPKVRYFPFLLRSWFVSFRKVYLKPVSKFPSQKIMFILKATFVPCTPFVHSRQPDLETESLKNKSCFYIVTP